jgi:hypothetical protein
MKRHLFAGKRILFLTLLILGVVLFRPVAASAQADSEDDITTVFIMKLKPGIPKAEATINDTETFTLKAGEPVLFDSETGMAYNADGRFGKLNFSQLRKLDTAYFKMNYSRMNFLLRKGDPLFDYAASQKTNINKLFMRVRVREKGAFTELFNMGDTLEDADAGDQFESYFWALLNTWPDKDLAAWLNTVSADARKNFSDYIPNGDNTYPVENPDQYLKLYYPESWKIIEKNVSGD